MTIQKIRKEINSAEKLIRQEIERSGPMTFYRFMDLALYHPLYGYYNREAPQRGRKGDYFTSAQVSPLFARILSDAVLAMREALSSEQFTLIEVGAGDGELLENILRAFSEIGRLKGLKVWAVEKSRAGRDRIWRRLSRFAKCQVVESLDQIEWMGAVEGCILSNELFDAIPFHRLRLTPTGWKEIYVATEEDRLQEKEGPLSDSRLADRLISREAEFADGQEVEVRPSFEALYAEWGQWLARGYIMTFDYGHPRFDLYSPVRPKGTWLCYSEHKANQEPLERVGRQDITAHVDFTQLAQEGETAGFNPALFCSQGIFLAHAGAARIEEALKTASDQEQRHLKGALQQLLHPTAMGESFWMLLQAKGIAMPDSFQAMPNRKRRLTVP